MPFPARSEGSVKPEHSKWVFESGRPMNETDLKQRLLEWQYGLLSDAEAAELQRLIESSPEAAAQATEVRAIADKLARAARLTTTGSSTRSQAPLGNAHGEALLPVPPSSAASATAAPTMAMTSLSDAMVGAEYGDGKQSFPNGVPKQSLGTSELSRSAVQRRVLKTLLALTFLWMAAFGGGHWYFENEWRFTGPVEATPGLRLTARERTDVVGLQNAIDIEARNERGEPTSVKLRAEVVGNGRSLFASDVETDRFGRANVILPAVLKLPQDSEFIFKCAMDSMPQVEGKVKLSPTRCITHLSFDKLLYRPGEVVRFRSLTVERFSMKPAEKQSVAYKLIDPSGATLMQHTSGTTIGVAAYEWPIPATQVGGTYTVECSSLDGFFPVEKKTFHIQQYRAPRFKKDLVFAKDSYGPGDVVKADFSALRAEGGAASMARLTISASVDGQSVFANNIAASESGTAAIEFPLPQSISTGDGRLSITIDDGGTRETLTRTIPIQLNRIDLVFYPESGDIVSGLENRVYFVARNPQGKPVHVAGKVVNRAGREVAATEVLYDGMGSFTFTPAFGEQYRLQLTQPTSTTAEFNLPLPKDEQKVVLSGGRGVFSSGEPLELTVWSKQAVSQLLLTAHCRGVFVGREMIAAQPGSNSVALSLLDQASGVIRVTVWDASQTPAQPLAERLVYRRGARELRVEVQAANTFNRDPLGSASQDAATTNDGALPGESAPQRVAAKRASFAPGAHAKLKFKVTNERGEPVAAAFGIAVVDDAVISLTDDEHKEPSLKTHLLVGSEVDSPEDIEDVEFYVAPGEKSAAALDHLLGTQGWRRFIEKRYDELLKDVAQREQVERLNQLGGLKCGVVDPQDFFASLPRVLTDIVDRSQLRRVFDRVAYAVAMMLIFALLVTLATRPRQRSTTMWVLLLSMSVAGVVIGCGKQQYDVSPTSAAPKKSAMRAEAATPPTSDVEMFADAARSQSDPAGIVISSGGKDDPSTSAEEAIPGDQSSSREANLGSAPAKADESQRFRFVPGSKNAPARNPGAGGPPQSTVILREYAHKHRVPQSPDEERSDFTETLFWNPLLIADRNGEATIEFDLSDSITTFRVLADAHAYDGRIGTGKSEIASKRAFYIEPKLPLEVTAGDRIDLPVAVVNDSAAAIGAKVTLAASPLLRVIGPLEQELSIAADQRARQHYSLEVTGEKGDAEVKLRGVSGTSSDRVKRSVRIVPTGFPVTTSLSGTLTDAEQAVSLKLPQSWTPGSLNVTLRAFPTPAADVLQGLEGMLQEPCGCFEQTTSSNYPNVLVLRYLQSNGIARPDVTARAKDMLGRGYSRLVGYESKSGGFEWFGRDPGHEALTAFGLMEFADMQPVFNVDSEMLARTTKWLLSRRNGKGGFERNPNHLHVWAVQQDVVDAYVVWALTETGMKDVINQLSLELEHVRSLGERSTDPYLIALAAASLTNAGQTAAADALLDKLAGKQGANGKLEGSASITQSGGQSLWVETTALAALAWQKRPQFATHTEKAVGWIRSQRSGSGHFGSTQATVLALKALIGTGSSDSTTEPIKNGAINVQLGNEQLGRADFAADRLDPISISNFAEKLKPGENLLKLMTTGGRKMPFTIEVSYRAARPDNDGKCPVTISTKLASEKLAAGAVTTLEAQITNTKREGLPMTLAVLGIPAGLEVRTTQLDELKDKGVIDYFELKGREVICYWRMLDPEKVIDLKLDLTAEIPGTYTGPASQCYLYYTAENKFWADPLKVEIAKE